MSVLPLHLLDFSGHLQNGDVVLNWKTTNENNTNYFDIERSADGTGFLKLDAVSAAGISSSALLYNYTDNISKSYQAPVVYYRLKMVDRDGKFTYSNVIALNISNKEAMIALYPNPVSQSAILVINAVKKETITLSIMDQNGRLLSTERVNVNPQANNINLNLSAMRSGIYTLTVKGPFTAKEIKMVKK